MSICIERNIKHFQLRVMIVLPFLHILFGKHRDSGWFFEATRR